MTAYVVAVLAISLMPEAKLLEADHCHLDTVPVCPFNVRLVVLVPEHTVEPPVIEPPTAAELTVIVNVLLLAVQAPLVANTL